MDRNKRIAALIALAVVVVVAIAVVIRSSSGGYEVVAEMDNAGQIIRGNDVRIGAAKVGKVTDVRLTTRGTAEIVMDIDDKDAPLQEGTSATIRASSVLGLTNRYIVLSPPPGVSEPLPDGGTIGLAQTTSPVEFDAVLSALDEPTRIGLSSLVKGQAAIYSGRTDEASEAIKWAAPALSGTAGVMGELARDQAGFASLLRNGSAVSTAVNTRRDDLVNLISNANATTEALGAQTDALGRAIGQLPDTMRRADTTFTALHPTFDRLDELFAAIRTDARGLAPFLADLRPLLARGAKVVPKLAKTLKTPGKRNDLTNLFNRLPKLAVAAQRMSPNTIAAFDGSEDALQLLRGYTPDIFGAISNIDSVASTYDTNGHYLRGIPVMGAVHYDNGLNQLQPQPTSQRLNGFDLSTSHRCPGTAAQLPPDGSAPVIMPGCNPLIYPSGP